MIFRVLRFSQSFLSDPLSHWPFTEIVRQCFGNSAGVRQNIFGTIHKVMRRLTGRRSVGLFSNSETKGLVRDLKKNGLLFIDQMLSDEIVNRIMSAVERLNNSQGPFDGYIRTWGSNEIASNVPEAFEVFTRDVQILVEEHFNSYFTIDDILVRLTVHAPPEAIAELEVYNDEWHCDSSPTSELGMFVLLHDTSEEDGPTHAISKPQTRHLVRRYYKSRNRQSIDKFRDKLESASGEMQFIGKKGSVLFVETTQCLHRASIPSPGHRRAVLMIRLLPSGHVTDLTKTAKSQVYRWTHRKKKSQQKDLEANVKK